MGDHEFSIARQRRLRAAARLTAIVVELSCALLAAASCSRLESTGTDGGGGQMTNTGSSSGSTGIGSTSSGGGTGGGSGGVSSGGGSGSSGGFQAPGIDAGDMFVAPDASVDAGRMACGAATYTDPWTPGYVIASKASSDAQMVVGGLSLPQQANIMRGTRSGCGTMNQNYNDFFRNGGSAGDPPSGNTSIPSMRFRDGPRGVCLVPYSTVVAAKNTFPNGDYATTFPSASARGAAFDMDLEQRIGAAIGDEMVAAGAQVVLAPVINILRNPAWGRAQETYGEDSYLLGRLGTAFVSGAQSYIPACAKHFAAYNIENGRDSGNVSVLDEQTAYEIYGRHFEMVVQDGGVACIMAAYNKIQIGGGVTANCTSNKDLLTTMLRTKFGFQGFVISDWWAMPGGAGCPATGTETGNTADGVNAGLDIELPWNMNYSQLEADVSGGLLNQSQITTSATRVAAQQFRFGMVPSGATKPTASKSSFNAGNFSIVNNPDHVSLSYRAAVESMVLLKNDNKTLPIPSSVHTIAVMGARVPFSLSTSADVQSGSVQFATDVRSGDLGSSRTYTDPAHSTGPLAGIQAAAAAKGITVVSGTDRNNIPAADFYVVVAGLTPQDEGEGYTSSDGTGGDRTNFDLDGKIGLQPAPNNVPIQNPLITAVAQKGKPTVVVLEGGSVIAMPWLSMVPAVVMAWYPGQDGGHALGDLLFGNANFSGKLPVTWPNSFGDEPALVGANKTTTMDYYVGYRYFDKNAITPLFAFGHGLSYASFSYANLQVPCTTVTKDSVVDVQADITNTGTVDGDEVSFVFVSYPKGSQVRRSMKELKAFHRATIPAGKTLHVHIPLRIQDLKYWDSTSHSWQWQTGDTQIMVGGSSDGLPLTGTITM
ncbi:MAG: glycoside hydrolase family 3 C-terminal domain-containing protein [Myxococcota bacterium]|nr:glycoside hydrolase family 3 C-terminal domain-containing protein [Myxococcota bacterium]